MTRRGVSFLGRARVSGVFFSEFLSPLLVDGRFRFGLQVPPHVYRPLLTHEKEDAPLFARKRAGRLETACVQL